MGMVLLLLMLVAQIPTPLDFELEMTGVEEELEATEVEEEYQN